LSVDFQKTMSSFFDMLKLAGDTALLQVYKFLTVY